MAETKVETKQAGADAQAVVDRSSPHALEHAVAANKDISVRGLATPKAAVAEVLEQKLRVEDQRQEQALYSGVWAGWSGIVAVMAKTPSTDKTQGERQKLEALQEEVFHALAKEKKKKAFRDSPIFQRLVAVMGHEVAESVTKKLETALSNNPSGLQANSALLTQVAKDLASVLSKNQASLKIAISGEQLAPKLETEISRSLAVQPSLATPLRVADDKVKALHAEITSLTPGKDQMVKLLEMYGTMKREEFSALLDSYDQTYGIPLVDHIAQMSASSPAARAEVFEELVSVLTPEQKARHLEYGRAELGLTLASLSVEQKNAEEGVKSLGAELLKTASHLGDPSLLNIPQISALPPAERRAAVESAVRREFPGLKDAKDWQAIIKAMTGVQKEGALNQTVINNEQLTALLGTKITDPKQEAAARERIARITLLMGDLVRYEEQVGQLGKIALEGNSNEVALVTGAYEKLYGKEVREGLRDLTQAAQAHLDGLAFRIADSRTTEAERTTLLRERDAIEFSSVRTRLGIHLQGEKPDVARAQALLSLFETAHIDTPARRTVTYRQVASDLSRAITAAEEYRQQWVKLTPDAQRPITVVKEATVTACATHHGKPQELTSEQLHEAFRALSDKPAANKENPLQYFTSETERKKAIAELESLNREAAKTQWFAEVLNPGYVLTKTKGPTADHLGALLDKKKEAVGRELATLGKELDLVHERTRAGLWAIEQSSHSEFLSHGRIVESIGQLSSGVRAKLGVSTQAELREKISSHLNPDHPVGVDGTTIAALREAAKDDKGIQAVLSSVKAEGSAREQLSTILARLSPHDALRVKAFTTIHSMGRCPKDVKAAFLQISSADPLALSQIEVAARAESKILEIDRMVASLTDQERREVFNVFLQGTGTTIGARVRGLLPTGPGREQVVIAFAQSSFAHDADLRDLFDGEMPATRAEQVAVLRQAFAHDREKAKELDSITFQPSEALRELGILRAAAQIGGALGDHAVVEESTRALVSAERQAEFLVDTHVKRFSPGFSVRQGVREIATARLEQTIGTLATDAVHPDRKVAFNASRAASLLGADPANADGAYHQIRQANLSSSEMLLFRAFYREAVAHRKPQEGSRPLTGDFERDLASAKSDQSEYEKVRNAALVKGGSALKEADKVAIKHLSKLPEQQQLGALIDLKKSGELDAHKGSIDPATLKGDAKTYHAAVAEKPTSSDDSANRKVRAEALELKHKVSVKSATEDDVVAVASGKSAAQIAEVTKVYPKIADDLKVIAPRMAGEVDGLLSQSESDHRAAVERTLMNSLKNPREFERVLGMARSPEEKAEALVSIERTISANGRHFDPTESAIVQFVRSQRTDFREIDAVLISDILARHGSGGQRLAPDMVQQLHALRAQGTAQLEKMDAFHTLRSNVVKEALRYSGAKETHLGNAEADKARRLVTGWLRNDEIAATKDLINHHNKHILNPMFAGETDIRRSRELMRMGVAIIAKDLQKGVDGGVTLGSTQQVMSLNMRRDKEIAYKVFDEAKEQAWKTEVARTEKWVGYADTTVMVGMMFAKTIVVTGATLYGSPAAGLFVASVWNVADKTYRVTLQGESMRHAVISGGIEFGLDLIFAGASAYSQSKLVFQGGRVAEKSVEAASKTFREWRWFEPVVKPTQVEQIIEKGIVWRTGQSDKLKALFAEVKNGAEIGEKAAETGLRFQENAIKAQLAGKLDFIPEWMGVGANIWRKGGGGVPSELANILTPREKEAEGAGAVRIVSKNQGGRSEGVGVQGGDLEIVRPVPLSEPAQKDPVQQQAPINPPPQQWEVPQSLWNFILVAEQALLAKPDPDIQRALDDLKGVLGDVAVTEAQALEAARKVHEVIQAAAERDKSQTEWSPYPELAKALDGWLDGGNPWLLLGAALFADDKPAPPPVPPHIPPPPVVSAPPVNPPKPPPADRPAPGLQIAMAPAQGGMNGTQSGDVNTYVLAERQAQGVATVTGLTQGMVVGTVNGVTVAVPELNLIATPTSISNSQSQPLANVTFTGDVNTTIIAQRVSLLDASSASYGNLNGVAVSTLSAAEASKVITMNPQAASTPTSQGWLNEVGEATARTNADSARMREDHGTGERKIVAESQGGEQVVSLAKVAARKGPMMKATREDLNSAAVDAQNKARGTQPQSAKGDGNEQGSAETIGQKRKGLAGRAETSAMETALKTSASKAAADGKARDGNTQEVSASSAARLREGVGRLRDAGGSTSDREAMPYRAVARHSEGAAEAAHAHASHNAAAPIQSTTPRAQSTMIESIPVSSRSISVTSNTQAVISTLSPEEIDGRSSDTLTTRAGEEDHELIDELNGTEATPSRRGRTKRNPEADARLRATILRQLMEAHFTKAQREKLLKMLIALGISESEYRALVIKLGEMDVARRAEQQKVSREMIPIEELDEPVAKEPTKVAVPTVESEDGANRGTSANPEPSAPVTSRAELYRRLRDESAPKIRGQ